LCLPVNFRIHELKKSSFLDKQVHRTPARKRAAAVLWFFKKKKDCFHVNIAVTRELQRIRPWVFSELKVFRIFLEASAQ